MTFRINDPRRNIPSRPGEICGEQTEARSKISHRKSEKKKSKGCIHGEMTEVGVEKNSCEKAPPFTVRNSDRVHHSCVSKICRRMRLNSVKQSHQQHTTRTAPIEQTAFRGNLSSTRP